MAAHRDSHRRRGATAYFELEAPVLGARLVKEFTLRDGHPFLYERHAFHGGSGAIPVANHATTRFGPAGGRLAFSPKAFGFTTAAPQESDPTCGWSVLAYPARFTETTRVPFARGCHADLGRYPIADRHEDFVALVEAEGSPLG